MGVFLGESVSEGRLLVEYTGVKIRKSLIDMREAHYRSRGIGTYIFMLDDEHAIDATLWGGFARFVNHSCEPNCKATTITHHDGAMHIVMFACRK